MYYDNELDGYDSDPAKYHYLDSVPSRRSRRAMYDDSIYAPSLSRRDSLYGDDPYSDPYYRRPRRSSYGLSRASSIRPSTSAYYDAAGQAANYYDGVASDYYAGSGRSSSTFYDGVPGQIPYSGVNPPPTVVVDPTLGAVVPAVARPSITADSPYTVFLRVPICCDGCERRITRKLLRVPGVMSVWCDVPMQQVRVRGYFDTDEVLTVSRRAFRNSRLW